jgi:hypothetical protein
MHFSILGSTPVGGRSRALHHAQFWEWREAIVAFAGADINTNPEDEKYLLEFALKVTHYELFQ